MEIFQSAVPIWHPCRDRKDQTIEFETAFEIPRIVGPGHRILCFLYVHTQYALYLNGQFADAGSFPGYKDRRYYDVIDLGPHVHPGTNLFHLQAYSQGEDSFFVRFYGPEALFTVWETDENGELVEELLFSSPRVPVREDLRFLFGAPKISPQLSFSFDYDETKAQDGYVPSVSCGSLEDLLPFLAERPVSKLQLSPDVPHRIHLVGSLTERPDPLPSVRMQRSVLRLRAPDADPELPSENGIHLCAEPGSDGIALIVSLERHTVGLLTLDIELPGDTELLIGWGEHLEDGRVRTRIGPRNFAARLRLKAGRRTFFYPMKRMGAQYLQLHILSPSAILHDLALIETRYPLETIEPFPTADPVIRKIYEVSIATLRDCMHEHYEDCPWREQALYTMDSRNQMLCGYYAFHEFRFARASLELIAGSLREDDLLELISPGKAEITIPSFTAIYLIQCEEYLRYFRDERTLIRLMPVLDRIAGGLLSRIDAHGLIPRYEGSAYWNFYEWQTGLDGSDKETGDQTIYDAPMNAFAVMGIRSLAIIKKSLGPKAPEGLYITALEEGIRKIGNAYHEFFFDPGKGIYASFRSGDRLFHEAELTQTLSVLAGLVPSETRSAILEALADGRGLFPITLSHSIFKYEALLTDPQRYAPFVFSRIREDYSHMLSKGATTFWETIEGASAFDLAGSLCHGWSAVPVYFYQRYCADLLGEGTRIDPSLTGIPMMS